MKAGIKQQLGLEKPEPPVAEPKTAGLRLPVLPARAQHRARAGGRRDRRAGIPGHAAASTFRKGGLQLDQLNCSARWSGAS